MTRGSSALDLEALATIQVSARVDELGFGTYQYLLLVAVGSCELAECMDMGAIEPQNAALGIAFNLPLEIRAALPALVFLGNALGIFFSGVFSDWVGRKPVLVASNAGIIFAQLATASLPTGNTHHHRSWILMLRFIAGFTSGLGMPAAAVMAAESCPTNYRTAFMYGIHALGSCGYLISAFGLNIFMPNFGEVEGDRWRSFCVFTAIPAMVSLPLVFLFLSESPGFKAVRQDVEGCVKVLNRIAWLNGKPPLCDALQVPHMHVNSAFAWSMRFTEFLDTTFAFLSHNAILLFSLSLIEATKTFMVSGSAYITTQLFARAKTADDGTLDPTVLFTISSIAPIVGMLVGTKLSCTTAGMTFLLYASVAASLLWCLTWTWMATDPEMLLLIIMGIKLCYGPLSVTMVLIKVGGFPTEIRGTAFSFISLVACFGKILAPMLAEFAKGDGWTPKSLSGYIRKLVVATIASGFTAALLPASCGALEDYCDPSSRVACGEKAREKSKYRRISTSFSSFGVFETHDIFEIEEEDDESQTDEAPCASTPESIQTARGRGYGSFGSARASALV